MMGWWDNMWYTQIKKGESWARVGLANHRKPEFLHSRGFLQLFAVGDMGNQWKSSTFQRFEMISLGGEIHKHQAAIRGNWWQSISNMLQLSGSFSRVQVGYPTFLTFMGNCSSLVASNQDKFTRQGHWFPMRVPLRWIMVYDGQAKSWWSETCFWSRIPYVNGLVCLGKYRKTMVFTIKYGVFL